MVLVSGQKPYAKGLCPIQIWVLDVYARSLRSEAHRQSLTVAVSAYARDDQMFVNAAFDWGEE